MVGPQTNSDFENALDFGRLKIGKRQDKRFQMIPLRRLGYLAHMADGLQIQVRAASCVVPKVVHLRLFPALLGCLFNS